MGGQKRGSQASDRLSDVGQSASPDKQSKQDMQEPISGEFDFKPQKMQTEDGKPRRKENTERVDVNQNNSIAEF